MLQRTKCCAPEKILPITFTLKRTVPSKSHLSVYDDAWLLNSHYL